MKRRPKAADSDTVVFDLTLIGRDDTTTQASHAMVACNCDPLHRGRAMIGRLIAMGWFSWLRRRPPVPEPSLREVMTRAIVQVAADAKADSSRRPCLGARRARPPA